MKLRKLHIEDYKMFKDFNINFVDENDEALPIVVLAGVNGSGKTTLLEFISESLYREVNAKNYIQTYGFKKAKDIRFSPETSKMVTFKENKDTLYFSSEKNDISKVEKLFIKYWYNQVKFHNKRNDEITKNLQKFIIESFNGLALNFTYSHIDEDDNIYFKNDNQKFKISELSTGEQTLLSKVLYLFLKEYKDKVILIDEPELSLHPSWQNKVLKIYENFAFKNNCQIIIATHSPHIIGSAKPEYLRLLKKEDDKIVVVDNVDKSYGLEFDKILTDIMGVENLRTPEVAKDIKSLWKLLENEEYQTKEYEEIYQKLEKDLGDLDKDLVLARLEVARIKSRNAKSK